MRNILSLYSWERFVFYNMVIIIWKDFG